MAHLTCVHHTRAELVDILGDYRDAGIENLMLLGGDVDPDHGAVGDLRHAIELVALAREVGEFCIGVAAHPAGHPDSPDLVSDRRFLADKLELADFCATQMFFERREWRGLVEQLGSLGVTKPVLPGIMPATTARLARADARHGRRGARLARRTPRRGLRARPRCGARRRDRRGDRAVPRAARRRCPGAALLHAQPLDGDA